MATTFTSNYQIKLIGTGLEAGTWGTSNNENFKRVEQALGGSSLAFNLGVPGAPSTYNSGTETLTWLVGNNIDSSEAGSDGRNKFVVFVDSGDLGADQIVLIRGDTATSMTDRIYFVKNSLNGSRKITFDAGGSNDYVLENGCSAVIYSNAGATEVGNLLDTLQLAGLNFPAASDITILNGNAAALEIKDSAQTYVNLDTQSASVATITVDETKVVSANTTVGLAAAEATIRSNGNGDMTLKTGNPTTGSITIVDGSNEDILLKNHGTGKVMVGSSGHIATITSSGAHNLKLETNDGTSSGVIEITDGADQPITLTPNGTGSVAMSKVDIGNGEIDGTVIGANSAAAITGTVVTASTSLDGVIGTVTPAAITATTITGTGLIKGPDAQITGADGYINFDTATGTGGIGFRDLSTVIQAKDGNVDWTPVLPAGTVATSTYVPTGYGTKKASFVVGDCKLYVDTLDVADGASTVSLSGEFTAIWSVMACFADTSAPNNQNIHAYVLAASQTTVQLLNDKPASAVSTIWVVGQKA